MEQNEENNTKNRGSEWNKWDLHIHTPYTWQNNQYSAKNESEDAFINKILESNIKAIGLTNYFNFHEKELKSENSLKKKLEEKGVLVFPCIEFRLDAHNKNNKNINIHILFRNTLEEEKISTLLSSIETINRKRCSDISNEHESNSSQISQSKLFDALRNNPDVKPISDYIIIGCPYGYGGFRPSKDAGAKEKDLAITLEKNSHALYAATENPEISKAFYLKTDRYDGSIPKPVFLGSDAHETASIGDKYTWIKAKLSYAGLLQSLFSPKERIEFGLYPPDDLKENSLTIDSCEYNNGIIYFNKNVNTIIGKRGSGKSNILRLLSSYLDEEEFRERVEKDADVHIEYLQQNYGKINVKWSDNSSAKDRKVLYIPQGYIGSMSYDDGAKADIRDDFIKSLLRNNVSFVNAEKAITAFTSDNKSQIDQNVEKLFETIQNKDIVQKSIKALGEKTALNNTLKKISEKIKITNKAENASEQDVEEYTNATLEIDQTQSSIKIAKQDLKILENMAPSSESININEEKLNSLSKETYAAIKNEYKKAGLVTLDNIIKMQIRLMRSKIKQLNKVLKEKSEVIAKLKPKMDNYNESIKLAKKNSEIKATIAEIDKAESELGNYDKDTEDIILKLGTQFKKYHSETEKILGTIEHIKFEYLSISYVISQKRNFYENFIERNINVTKTSKMGKDAAKFIEEKSVDGIDIKNVIKDILKNNITLKATARDKLSVVKELLENYEAVDFLESIRTADGSSSFKNMTGGQKAIAILELIFKCNTNKYPVLIDQPEDDLDADGVSKHLVEFIKSQSTDRQFFIVTHNASLVVNADSDNVIVAKPCRNKKGFIYVNGAIEEKDISNQIMDIMEGGKDLLQQRIDKLRASS